MSSKARDALVNRHLSMIASCKTTVFRRTGHVTDDTNNVMCCLIATYGRDSMPVVLLILLSAEPLHCINTRTAEVEPRPVTSAHASATPTINYKRTKNGKSQQQNCCTRAAPHAAVCPADGLPGTCLPGSHALTPELASPNLARAWHATPRSPCSDAA